jgi:mannose/fructose/N-acetylgalactosamine-specific phosphotransferase system component IIB
MLNFLNGLWNFVQQPGNQQTLLLLVAGGAVAVSLIAAIISPIVALSVAGRQIRATVVSANRQRWIDGLRDTIAELMAINCFADADVPPEMRTKVYNLQNKILLLTNATDADHVELNRLIKELVAAPIVFRQGQTNTNVQVATGARTVKNINDLQQEIIEVSRRVLKSEWNRVRKGN